MDRVQKAIQYVKSLDMQNHELGTFPLEGNDYYMVQEYETKIPELKKLESHKRYVDIQWIVSGEEKISVSDVVNLKVMEAYDEKKDVMFWEGTENMMETVLTAGSYVVLYPKDAHMPGQAVEAPGKVKKFVIKVAV